MTIFDYHSVLNEQVVQACAGNLSEAARRPGISRNTLYRKLREMDCGSSPQ